MSLILGLTGGLATGKSTVASFLASLGANVLDADEVVHEALKKDQACLRKIILIFGTNVLTFGEIDRKKLAQVVFNNPSLLKKLERIVHPIVKKRFQKEIKLLKKKCPDKILVLEVPLLFESGLDKIVDYTLVVKAKRSQQIERAVKKFGFNRKEALKRIMRQMPLKEKIRYADFCIDNSRNLTITRKRIKKIWYELEQKKNRS